MRPPQSDRHRFGPRLMRGQRVIIAEHHKEGVDFVRDDFRRAVGPLVGDVNGLFVDVGYWSSTAWRLVSPVTG